jgi:nucleoside-diphosphate-sugar epimerase
MAILITGGSGLIGALRFDEEKARSEWGWKPSYSLPEMVDDFTREFDQNRFLFR